MPRFYYRLPQFGCYSQSPLGRYLEKNYPASAPGYTASYTPKHTYGITVREWYMQTNCPHSARLIRSDSIPHGYSDEMLVRMEYEHPKQVLYQAIKTPPAITASRIYNKRGTFVDPTSKNIRSHLTPTHIVIKYPLASRLYITLIKGLDKSFCGLMRYRN